MPVGPSLADQRNRIANLAQVVRRQIGGKADCDPRRAVDEHIGESSRQHGGLFQRVVKVVLPVDRIHVDVAQQLLAQRRQPDLGIAHRSWRVAIDRAKITLPVNQYLAHRKVLSHAGERIIHRLVAVWMVFAQHLTDDARALAMRRGRIEVHFTHSIGDAAMNGFEPIPYISDRPVQQRIVRVLTIHIAQLLGQFDRTASLARQQRRLVLRQLRTAAPGCRPLCAHGWPPFPFPASSVSQVSRIQLRRGSTALPIRRAISVCAR